MNYQRIYVYILPILVFTSITTTLLCQKDYLDPTTVRFKSVRDATKIDDYCYQLTRNKERSGGSLWYPQTIDLREDFFMDLNIYLGCDDLFGADGIVFIFSQRRNIGAKGGGMGFLRLKPSLGIEFDTYHNIRFGDPINDHVAILENGQINHNDQVNKPVSLAENIEDCQYHPLIIDWNSTNQLLSVTLDGKQIIQYKKDIVNEIFNGEHRVYWGVSAATGSDHNTHKICFNKLRVKPAGIIQQYSRRVEQDLNKGNFVVLKNLHFEGEDFLSNTGTRIALEKLYNFLRNNTDKHLDIFSHVHDTSNDQDLSMKRATALKEYLVNKGIKEDRLISKGVGSQYLRSKRDLKKGLSNTRIEIYLFNPLP